VKAEGTYCSTWHLLEAGHIKKEKPCVGEEAADHIQMELHHTQDCMSLPFLRLLLPVACHSRDLEAVLGFHILPSEAVAQRFKPHMVALLAELLHIDSIAPGSCSSNLRSSS
jgi:hypothetical protein